MIEITARLLREHTPVFLCGETVECFISFTNPTLPEHRISQSNNDILENLAWATAQIHCYRSSNQHDRDNNENAMVFTAETALNATSNQGQGQVEMVTDPKILFCDLRLSAGESKSYLYKETVPLHSPPTYRGIGIRYFYKITIATQRVGSKVQVLRCPIRVLPTIGAGAEDAPGAMLMCNETNEELAPTNPFLETRKSGGGESKLEVAMDHLQSITARRRPNFYLISNKRGRVGRFCLFKPVYKLGEDIVGTLDFTCRTVRCVQVSVTLQCEEILLAGSAAAATVTNGPAADAVSAGGKIISFTKHHEMCMGLLQTQMILPVPLYVTPSFTTALVDVRWRLHFEFVTSTMMGAGGADDLKADAAVAATTTAEHMWQAPADIPIETMVWNLPITLYPTSPMQILQQTSQYSLTIK